MRPAPLPDPETAALAAMAAHDYAKAEVICKRWDADETRPPPTLLPSALWYGYHGLAVFPLQPGSKVPMRGSRGCKDATTNPGVISAWWARYPTANIGIATGGLVDVIDIDGPLGVVSWARMDQLPVTLGTVSTPRPGGSHLYIKAAGLKNRAAIAPGIDVRGLGGYVVAPPSWSEEHQHHYYWRTPLDLGALQ